MRSNEEEGFYVDQPVLENIPVNINTSSRPVDYQPRYLIANKLLKREPVEVIQIQPECQILYSSVETKRRSSIKKQNPNIQCQVMKSHYCNKEVYQHVYNRSGNQTSSMQKDETLSDNLLSLNHLNQYSSLDYTVLKPFTFPECRKTGLLEFDSRFQGGNLAHAFYHRQTRQYHLIMQNDLNTNGYNQWFYFAVTGMRKGASYTFNIVNYRKNTSLFEDGMLPAIFSFQQNKWFRAGRNITYSKTNKVDSENSKQRLFRLSFNLLGEEKLMVASGIPYSYTKLMKSLRLMEQRAQSKESIKFNIGIAGYTLGNNAVPVITISSSQNTSNKKTIVITSRQHSGQVWSSYLCQELILQLIQNPYCKDILEMYIFKLYPMVNVDGVIYGNFRCDMGGVDLNRRWKQPCKYLQPHIFSIRQHLSTLHQRNAIEMYFDLHGHSKKLNCFCYCCSLNSDSRILPLMLSKLTSLLSFQDCTFGLEKYKSKTSRGFMFQLCQKINILTIQCSAFGYKQNQRNHHFEPKHMKLLAESLIMSMWVNLRQQNSFKDISTLKIKQEINCKREEFNQYDSNNCNDSGSDSDPEGQEMEESEKMLKVLPKKILKMIKGQEEEKDSVPKKKKKAKKNRTSVVKSNPKLNIPQKKESLLTTPPVQEKPPIGIYKRQPSRVREKSLSYYKQFEHVQQKITPLKSVFVSRTPMPFRPTPLVKIVQEITSKSRITKRMSKQLLFPPTNALDTKKTVQMPMIRRKTLPSQPECQQIRQTKSTTIKKQQKIPQVRVFNQKYLKAQGKQKGLCLISQTKQLQHMIKIQTHSRRDSCIVNHSYSTRKKQPIVNYDSYKNRDKNRSSLLNEVSKLWKFHVQKYTKQLEYNIL